MIATLKHMLLKNWTIWRIVKMVLSLIFIINGIMRLDYILITGGVFLMIHTLLNACAMCAGGNCEVPQK